VFILSVVLRVDNSYITMPNNEKYHYPPATFQYSRISGNGFTQGLWDCCSDIQGCNRCRRSTWDCWRIWYAKV